MPDRHEPVYAMWDEAQQEYVPAESRCVARWASAGFVLGTLHHVSGDMCGAEATEEAGDVPLCAHHYQRLIKWCNQEMDRESYERLIEAREELEREEERERWPQGRLARRGRKLDQHERDLEERRQELERDLKRRQRELDAERFRIAALRLERNIIYYIRRASDGLIKIGTSGDFARRMTTLRREHGEIRLLLTHEGAYEREDEMHGRFAALRVTGEWFRPGKPLLDWILSERQRGELVLPTTVAAAFIEELISASDLTEVA